MITSYQQLSWTEKNDMKNLIIKWLGLEGLIDEVVRIKTRDAIASFKDELVDYASSTIDNRYDLQGMESKLDDIDYLTQDLESRANRWDDIADKVEDFEPDTFLLDKVQSVDDRLTELVAGYKLDVQLVKEEF
tara:strand:- start:82 stop:480 length:399 start_codon:yes stop_codon:yes gene_type:complete